jgi:flagellar capping protein FliD
MDAVDKKYREKEHAANRDASTEDIAYKRYMANNGVHPLMMRREQADYLDTFGPDAQLFYLAFAFVDGTDGIANGIARHILSYVGSTLGEGDKRKKELKEKIDSLQEKIDEHLRQKEELEKTVDEVKCELRRIL